MKGSEERRLLNVPFFFLSVINNMNILEQGRFKDINSIRKLIKKTTDVKSD